jgi:hypothetical protein
MARRNPRQAAAATAAATAAGNETIAIVENIHAGLNLYLPLKSPAQMPALLATLEAHKSTTTTALRNLHYVHFARFLPMRDGSALWVITVFDGAFDMVKDPDAYDDTMRSYIVDFAATMGNIFTAILDFVQDAPRLPVQRYQREFVEFVRRNNVAGVNPWSAYPDRTVISILTANRLR